MRYERPDYSEVRRWALQQNGAVKATDIQRQFRVGWNWACSMLEELVRDRIIRQADNGYYVLEPRIAREPSLGSAGQRTRRPKQRINSEPCEVCGWCLPLCARGYDRVAGCHVHHIVPVSAGGNDEPCNLVSLCPNHHTAAHGLFPVRRKRYAGPTTREGLVEAIRKAEEGPETYLSWRMEQVQQNRQAMREEQERQTTPRVSRVSTSRARTAKGNVIRANRIVASLWPEEPPEEP